MVDQVDLRDILGSTKTVRLIRFAADNTAAGLLLWGVRLDCEYDWLFVDGPLIHSFEVYSASNATHSVVEVIGDIITLGILHRVVEVDRVIRPIVGVLLAEAKFKLTIFIDCCHADTRACTQSHKGYEGIMRYGEFSVWMNVKSYMKKFDKFLRTMKRMNTNEDNILYCRDVNADLIRDYIIWRKEVEGNSNGTINKALSPIIKTVKACCRKGWISRVESEEISELYLNDEGKSLDDSMEKEFLTIEQLRKFKELAGKAKYDRTREYADVFLFACFTGLRWSDLISLKWSEIDMDKNMIARMQYKGHTRKAKMLYIPLNNMSREILEKWNGRYDEFVFGLLPNDYDLSDEADFLKVKNAANRTINQSLQSIGNKMGLPFNLHIHLGRHTYAMMALNGGVDIKTTSALLGHASTLVTEKVYATLLPNTIAEVVGDKLNVKLD